MRMDDLTRFRGSRPSLYSQSISIADLGVYVMLHIMLNDSLPGAAQRLAERRALCESLERVEAATEAR